MIAHLSAWPHGPWARYRPYPPVAGPLPHLTVIIPAYNEGAMVEKAIAAVAASDYPASPHGNHLHRRRLHR